MSTQIEQKIRVLIDKPGIKSLLLILVAFLGSLIFGLAVIFASFIFPVLKSVSLFLPIGVAAVALSAAAYRYAWLPRYPVLDVSIRVIATLILFLFFIFMLGGWGISAMDAGLRAKEYLQR